MLAALAVLAVVTLLARRTVTSPALARLRVVLPSWRLFDRAVAGPRLWLRIDGGAWRPLEAPPRGWLGWAFAPAGNLALACQGAVEQLVAELGELALEDDGAKGPVATEPEVTGLAAYQLVSRVARAHVPAGARFAWKIVVPGPIDYVQSPELA